MMVAQDEERLGWKEMEQGQLEQAETHFRRALEMDPFRADSLTGLGVVYFSWGELDEAQELFQMAVLQAQQDLPRKKRHTGWEDQNVRPYLRSLYHLALVFMREGRWKEAQEPLEEMLAWDDSAMDGEAYYLLALMYHRLGRLTDAFPLYEKALGRHPEALYSLGLLAYLQGEAEPAARYWRQGVKAIDEIFPLLAYYPVVQPLPVVPVQQMPYLLAIQYYDDCFDLWPDSAREQLRRTIAGAEDSLQGS
ncbi:MAG: tetratricopeptide repeat protein [Firmicutes bacterium]|nr:tetratricopeptide repeat protein [Bacillota bacterium]